MFIYCLEETNREIELLELSQNRTILSLGSPSLNIHLDIKIAVKIVSRPNNLSRIVFVIAESEN